MNSKLNKQRSLQILNDIRSEISSDKMDSQSEYSDYSAITAQYKV